MLGIVSASGLLLQSAGCMQLKSIARKIKGRLRKSGALPPEEQRAIVVLPREGRSISVEKALNSRCSSDWDNDPAIGHWGMFDPDKKLSRGQINEIIGLAKIPRFTKYACEIHYEKNLLSFSVDARAEGTEREILMIESGMQQQAMSLVCAALGAGSLIKNRGIDGQQMPDNTICTVSMVLDPMKPSYEGSLWSVNHPQKESPWMKGNLPDPRRDGRVPLLTAMDNLATGDDKNSLHSTITTEELGQALWAAKGRTPHFYKSIPWGMTIPTWNGMREITSVYVSNDHGFYKYRNWEKNRPTHSLIPLSASDKRLHTKLLNAFPGKKVFILIKDNESNGAALWEIGYALISTLLQLHSLNVRAGVIFPRRNHEQLFDDCSIGVPPVLMAL
jgi:hypothetical protein